MNEEQIITENIYLIPFMIKKLKLTYTSEDEYQEYYDDGLVGLIYGSKKYNESKKIKLSTYLTVCIKNQICKGMYLRCMDKRKANKYNISLNKKIFKNEDCELIDFLLDKNVNVEEEVEKNVLIETIVNIVKEIDNERYKEAFFMYYGLEGKKQMNYNLIAKEMGITSSMSCHMVKKAIKYIKERIGNE